MRLIIGGKLQARVDTLLNSLVTAIAGENEIDTGKHIQVVQLIDHSPTSRGMPFGLIRRRGASPPVAAGMATPLELAATLFATSA